MLDDGKFEAALKQRYAGWDTGLGQKIEKGKVGFEELERYILDNGEPELVSGRQELLENMLNDYIC